MPATWETWARSLGWEDLLERRMATHSSNLAWRIPWTEKPGRLQSMGSQRVGHDWATSLSLSFTQVRVPWIARRSNQSILKEISPMCSLEGLMLKLKLQYFGHLIRRADSLEKTLMLGGIGGRRKRGRQRMRWLDGITDSMDVSLTELRSWWWTGRPGVLQFMGSQRIGHDWVTELNWTELNWTDTSEKLSGIRKVYKESSICEGSQIWKHGNICQNFSNHGKLLKRMSS